MSPADIDQPSTGTEAGRARPIRLHAPRPPEDPPAGSLPILASLAPVVGSCVLFAVTGSPATLVFAALGPLIAIAGFVDARWTRRRRGRAARAVYRSAVRQLEEDIERAHADDRRERESLHPSGRALDLLAAADPTRWRAPDGRRTLVVLGRGEALSSVRIDGAADDPRWARATRLANAPVVVDAMEGIGIVGGQVFARAVARSIVLQLARSLAPDDASFVAPAASSADGSPDAHWRFLARLPHDDDPGSDGVRAASEADAPVRVRVVERWGGSDESSSAGKRRPAPGGVLIALADAGEFIPARCRHLLVLGADGTTLLVDGTGTSAATPVSPTPLAEAEAEHLAGALGQAALTTGESSRRSRLSGTVALADLDGAADLGPKRPAPWDPEQLRVGVGLTEDGPLLLDLVADGPHALVGGTTGSGKSELLITWITALAGRSSPEELSFLLIDCKGGAAFQSVAGLPHVVGMVTDLEPAAADRVVSSLRAELRHRERVLARHGARHLLDPELPTDERPARLVVVVDEFQALLDASPHLHHVFADLAARGRSLGLHLVLCSQRPAAVAADAILANCTLRLSLRVTSRQDSTAILGVPDAAALPAAAVGRCLVWDGDRRVEFQVATTSADDLLDVHRRWRGATAPRRPWLDPLPERLHLAELHPFEPGGGVVSTTDGDRHAEHADAIVFGLADLPEQQAQRAAVWYPSTDGSLLVLGAGRTGRTTFLDTVEEASAGRWRIDRVHHDPEQAWDTIMALADPLREAAPTLLLVDDVESVLAAAGDEHGAALRDALLGVLRDGSRRGIRVVLVASRLGGVVHRLAAQLDRTLVLRLADRQEHLVAGAPAACFDQRRPPGRAYWDDGEVQIALPDALRTPAPQVTAPAILWRPAPGTTTVLVTRASRAVRSALIQAVAAGERIHVIEPAFGSSHAPVVGGAFLPPWGGSPAADVATVVVVDPETWLAGRLAVGRELPSGAPGADLILHGCSAGDFRQITRSRELPPLLGYGSARAWWWAAGHEARRVDLLGGPS